MYNTIIPQERVSEGSELRVLNWRFAWWGYDLSTWTLEAGPPHTKLWHLVASCLCLYLVNNSMTYKGDPLMSHPESVNSSIIQSGTEACTVAILQRYLCIDGANLFTVVSSCA